MSIIYLDEQGAKLSRKDGCLLVEKDDKPISEIPNTQIDRLVIVGNISITTPTLAFLLDSAIPTSFISSHGRYRGELLSNHSKNIILRLAQFRHYEDSNFRLLFSKTIVSAKLENSYHHLLRHKRNHPETQLDDKTTQLENIKSDVSQAENLETLRGLEGISAKLYFQALGKMVRKEFSFTERSRRPPRDPVNALLSLGYTLLYSEIFSALASNGFDTYLGFYHDVEYGRPSLAVDMMEEFRYLIDGLVLSLINKDVLKKEDFENSNEDDGVYLTAKGRKIFYQQYENRLREKIKYERTNETIDFRRVFFNQAQLLGQAITNNDVQYQPFLIR